MHPNVIESKEAKQHGECSKWPEMEMGMDKGRERDREKGHLVQSQGHLQRRGHLDGTVVLIEHPLLDSRKEQTN